MSDLSKAVRELEARREALESELDSVDARLRSIRAALGNRDMNHGAGAKSASRRDTGAAKANGKSTPVGRNTVKRWFERGEAEVLLQKLLSKPQRPRDAIEGLAAMKGYAGTLSNQARERFNWAARSALHAAVSGKRILRNKDGLLQVPAAKK